LSEITVAPTDATVEIIFIQPNKPPEGGLDLCIDFESFAAHVAEFPDPFSQRFSAHLLRWKDPAGSGARQSIVK
jgi:hypothetical protein